MIHIPTGASPDSALPDTDPQDRTERQLRKLEELSNRAMNLVRSLHLRLQRPEDAPEPTQAEAKDLRETAALFLRAVREARILVESEARIVATTESLALRREKLRQTAHASRKVDQARATRNRRMIKDHLHSAIVIECPAEEIRPLQEKLAHMVADLTAEDLVYCSIEDNIARLRDALNIVDRSLKSDFTRWPPAGNHAQAP